MSKLGKYSMEFRGIRDYINEICRIFAGHEKVDAVRLPPSPTASANKGTLFQDEASGLLLDHKKRMLKCSIVEFNQ